MKQPVKRDLQALLRKKMTRGEFLGFSVMAGLSLIGITRLLSELRSQAANLPTAIEPELGSLGGGASVVTSAGASGGQAIKFAAGGAPGALPYGPYGSYKPGASTTGVRAGTTLTPYTNQFGAIVNGTLTLKTAGVSISGYDIPAYINVKAADITIKNCAVRGPAVIPDGNGHSLITCYSSSTDPSSLAQNLLVQDCTIAPQTPSGRIQGMQGHSFMIERCNVYHGVDGIDPLGEDCTILANYVHDLAWFTVNTGQADGHTHNDCVQPGGGSFTAKYNNFQGFLSPTVGEGPARPHDQSNAVFLLSDNTATGLHEIVITDNWMDGGAVAINGISAANTTWANGSQGPITIANNIIGDNQQFSGATIEFTSPSEAAAAGLVLTNNKYGVVDRPLAKPSRNGTVIAVGNGFVYAG